MYGQVSVKVHYETLNKPRINWNGFENMPESHKEALRLNRSLIQFRLPYGLRSREVLQQLNEWKQQLNFHL